MAYMLIASLPSVVGLHTATVASFFFMAFRTTRNVLSVGEQARPVSAWAMCTRVAFRNLLFKA